MIRVIPCLDMKDGRVVKGVQFVSLRDIGDPVEAARAYEEAGADELVLLDIAATSEARDTAAAAVERVAGAISIPLAVGGGVRTVRDFERLFAAGAAKVSVNTAAVDRPELIQEAAEAFGSERVVVAVDAKKVDGAWHVLKAGGMVDTGVDALEWVREVERRGAGEILLTSLDRDGVQNGYDLELTRAVADAVSVPVIASGGAGNLEHFSEAVTEGGASAVLAASLFHDGDLTVGQVKDHLASRGIPVRGR